MGYDHIPLCQSASNLFTIIIPWVKYYYNHLLMGIANSPDILQQKINDLFHIFEFSRAYMDELLTLKKGDWTDNAHKL